MFVYFTCVEAQHRVSQVIPEKCLTGLGYMEADSKVSTFEINIICESMDEKFKI
jgi:hypothetical protein